MYGILRENVCGRGSLMKRKIQNLWFYYKKYILAGMIFCLFIGNQLYEQKKRIRSDYQIAFVTQEYISEDIRKQVIEVVTGFAEDINQDGIVYVTEYLYCYDANTETARNPSAFMAAAVQLAADLKEKESVLYITDCPDILMEADMELVYGTNWERIEELQSIVSGRLSGYAVLVREPKGSYLLDKMN